MSTILGLNNITVEGHNKLPRLIDINIEIYPGDKIALIGKSGSGKSTLIKVANGSLSPSKGTVVFKKINIEKLKSKEKRSIGTLWQDLRLIEELSVGQNVNSGALGRHSILWSIANLIFILEKEKCTNCLKAANLSKDLIKKSVKELSSGQRKRVAIARLLRQQSQLILADEPFSDLDPVLAKKILLTLLNRSKKNNLLIPDTSVISLHQIDFISCFTRVIGLRMGKLIFDLPIKDINKNLLDDLYK
ncbi:ATP-binding cassette domain-containing protein [Prochlorococcus marinus]|uniref:ATP-binding cassette domain-containing protein n=1 Tax=Prochlorococcus marinus TaxID=1219 RepID=UPI0022B2D407|nr:ATP-binding cassette domain-containing protein [Prochlorococcus marinus]